MENKTLPRDLFVYLLVVIALTMSATSLWTVLSNLINVYLPDLAQPKCFGDSCADGIRSALSILIVAFPVLVWTWRFIRRDLVAHPEKSDLKVRKWLLYCTLFVAGAFMLGDLIALLNGWFSGDLTLPSSLDILTILVIAGAIFSYFLRELHPKPSADYRTAIARGAIALVLIAIVGGFVAAGSPFAARARRLDEVRVNDLGSLQYQVVGVFWTAKGRLPALLDELADPVSGFMLPVDPETKQAYGYRVSGAQQFQLCATFATTSPGNDMRRIYPQSMPYPAAGEFPATSWAHPAGVFCFDRTIDPDLYPPKVPKQ